MPVVIKLFLLFHVLLKNDLDVIASNANDKHSIPWAEACTKSDIHNTPLTPFIQKDNLIGYQIHLNGSKFINSSGYIFKYPKITNDLLKQVSIHRLFLRGLVIYIDNCSCRFSMILSR